MEEISMEKVTAAKAKQNFGELLDKAQRGPVEITKHGRRVGVLIAAEDYSAHDVELEPWMVERIKKGQAQARNGEGTQDQEVYARLRQQVLGWQREIAKEPMGK
jgi:prevent-host-death family protein